MADRQHYVGDGVYLLCKDLTTDWQTFTQTIGDFVVFDKLKRIHPCGF